MGGERFNTVGQCRIAVDNAGMGPAQRRGGIDGGVEIVSEHGAERLLVALGDGDAVDNRRPKVLGHAIDEL